jgi:hypothetical protein
MPIDPLSMMGDSLTDQVDAALKGMVDDLQEADRGVIAVIREAAIAWDTAKVEGKSLSAMTYLSYVTNGLEKLGGSVAARKALGKKAEKPKSGLAAVRGIREAPSAKAQDAKPAAARKPRAPRKPKATGT